MESQPQNPEFRNTPENFHPRIYLLMCVSVCVRARVFACVFVCVFNIVLVFDQYLWYFPVLFTC